MIIPGSNTSFSSPSRVLFNDRNLRESKGFSDTLGIGTWSSISLRGLNLISVSPIKKVSDGSLIRGSISDFFASEGGIESRARKASVSSKRESLSPKGVRDEERDATTRSEEGLGLPLKG
ncbi:hypothetical protein Tco_0105153 [Tanacetum coccineum]